MVFWLCFVTLVFVWRNRRVRCRQRFYRRTTSCITSGPETTESNPRHAQRKPAWATQEVLRLKVLMGHAGCRAVARTFNRLHQAHANRACTVSKTFVADCLKTNQYALAALRRDMRRQLPRPVPINAMWAMDMTFYTDVHGTQYAALGMLDHGSRLALCLQTLVKRNSWAMLGHLCFAIAKYGKPKRLRTDNERVFTSFAFTTFLKLVGIDHQRIQTCAPWQNGRMERLFGTLKPLLRQLVIPSKTALQLAMDEFTLFYNHARPHQNLGGLTPAEKWNGYSPRDLAQTPLKCAVLVQALDGLLVGYWMRR